MSKSNHTDEMPMHVKAGQSAEAVAVCIIEAQGLLTRVERAKAGIRVMGIGHQSGQQLHY